MRLLLVAHGSRDPRFGDTAHRVRAAVARQLPGVDVGVSFLDLNTPTVASELASATGDTIVVPLLLAPGYHSAVDLPAIVTEHAAGRVTCTDVVGRASLTEAMADRLREAGLAPGDGIVVTAVGSTDPEAERVVRRRAMELGTRLSRPVQVVFATRLGRDHHALRTAVHRLRTAGAGRIAVSPYFLSAGLLTERVEDALDILAPGSLVAGPIGTHPDLIDAVLAAYRHAARTVAGATR